MKIHFANEELACIAMKSLPAEAHTEKESADVVIYAGQDNDASENELRELLDQGRCVIAVAPSDSVVDALESLAGIRLSPATISVCAARSRSGAYWLHERTDEASVANAERFSSAAIPSRHRLHTAHSLLGLCSASLVDEGLNHLRWAQKAEMDDIPAEIPTIRVARSSAYAWRPRRAGKEMHGGSEASINMKLQAIAFLNRPKQGNPFQDIFVRVTGHVNPGLVYHQKFEAGWVNEHVNVDVGLLEQDAPVFLGDHKPINHAGVCTATDTLGLDIGFLRDVGHSTFHFSRQLSHDLSDWRVADKSKASRAIWEYSMVNPYDGAKALQDGYNRVHAFFLHEVGAGINTLPELSLHTLSFDLASCWRTNEILDKTVTFRAITNQSVVYLNCGWLGLGAEAYPDRNFDILEGIPIDLSKISD